ncbi:MAG: GTPase [Thermoplasmata archaeon]|nr:MAG: GTPase [Thermoplasmata archaeon]
MFVLILGPAGSGKTTLVKRLKEYNTISINLDPASETKADINIRQWVRTEEVQKKFSLGINGALLKSMEIIAEREEWIDGRDEIKVIDTPGQLEIFLYHDYGKKIVQKLCLRDIITGVFVVDATETSSIENYLSLLAQNAIINLRLGIPLLTAINKVDLVDRGKLLSFMRKDALKEMLEGGDALLNLAKGLIEYVEYTSIFQRPLLISAKTGEGIDDLYSAIYEVHCGCGDIS